MSAEQGKTGAGASEETTSDSIIAGSRFAGLTTEVRNELVRAVLAGALGQRILDQAAMYRGACHGV